MTRRLLVAMMSLGLLVTATGLTGIYAVFTDRAETGANTVTTGTEPKAVDLQVKIVPYVADCNDPTGYADNSQVSLVSATDVHPGWFESDQAIVCLRNAGSATFAASYTVVDLADVETACTGDEAANGDATCGTGAGELSEVLFVGYNLYTCAGGTLLYAAEDPMDTVAAGSVALGSLGSGEIMCLRAYATYPEIGPQTTLLESQLAQSDQVTWKFAFDVSAP